MDVSIFIAFAAGLVSFLSPCVFPVIPSYLTYIGGISLSELEVSRRGRALLLVNSLLFVLGFTAVFTLLGVFFSGVGIALSGINRYINIAAGVVVIVLGLNFIFDFWKLLNLEKRFHFSRRPNGVLGSLLLGMAFGAGWTPCIGPILASILFLASGSGAVGQGALLLLIYSFGLGLPFIIAGIFIASFQRMFSKVSRHLQAIKVGSGIFLVLIGILIFTGQLNKINMYLFQAAYWVESTAEAHPAVTAFIAGLIFLIPSLLLFRSAYRSACRNSSRGKGQNAAPETEAAGSEEIPAIAAAAAGKKRPPVVRSIFAVLFLVGSLLAFSGVFNIGGFLAAWLTFQGL
jgi:cytochrome c-type biogenesis protein